MVTLYLKTLHGDNIMVIRMLMVALLNSLQGIMWFMVALLNSLQGIMWSWSLLHLEPTQFTVSSVCHLSI